MRSAAWSVSDIAKCQAETGLAVLTDEQTLSSTNQDFGKMVSGQAVGVFQAQDLSSLQKLLRFAHSHRRPVTIRASGLSQSGQSLSLPGGLTLDVVGLNSRLDWVAEDRLRVGCGVSWRALAHEALSRSQLPYVYPYNTDLTVGGVLSVGGIGASTFKSGVAGAHVAGLSLVLANGDFVRCDRDTHPDLFEACLAGGGRLGVIYDVDFTLRACPSRVTTLVLAYDEESSWLEDQFALRHHADYLEAQVLLSHGSKANREFRTSIGLEHDEDATPNLDFLAELSNIGILDKVEQPVFDYVCRHEPRLRGLKRSGLWRTHHPWYECYVSINSLLPILDEVIRCIDPSLGETLHIFPVRKVAPKYFVLPEGEKILTFNILPPGVQADQLGKALQSLREIDEKLLAIGGKRYISGWFSREREDYWRCHYGDLWSERSAVKLKYDPHSIFSSQCFP